MKNIGFIGIGTMGKGMVENLLKNGFNVFAYNRTRSKAEAIKHENFNIVASPKELPEKTDDKSEAYKAGYKTIAEIGKERIRRVIKNIEKEHKEKSKLDQTTMMVEPMLV